MLKIEGCGKQREATAPIQFLVKVQPWFLSLRWKICLRQNCSLGSCACSEWPALGQNSLMMMMMMMIKIHLLFCTFTDFGYSSGHYQKLNCKIIRIGLSYNYCLWNFSCIVQKWTLSFHQIRLILKQMRGWECKWYKSVWANSEQWTLHLRLLTILVWEKKSDFVLCLNNSSKLQLENMDCRDWQRTKFLSA